MSFYFHFFQNLRLGRSQKNQLILINHSMRSSIIHEFDAQKRFFIDINLRDLFHVVFDFHVWFIYDSQILFNFSLCWHFCVNSFVQTVFFDFEMGFWSADCFFISRKCRVILLQIIFICCAHFEFFKHILIFICNLLKWMLNNKIMIFILNI